MPREVKTATELQALFEKHLSKALAGEATVGEKIEAGLIVFSQRDPGGCNWDMPYVKNFGNRRKLIRSVLAELRGRFNLPT